MLQEKPTNLKQFRIDIFFSDPNLRIAVMTRASLLEDWSEGMR